MSSMSTTISCAALLRILIALTEPVFRQIRRVIPPIGGLDLSPIVVFVLIWFLQYTISWAVVPLRILSHDRHSH